ncbi:hypothetical protein MLD38_029625 [Melastoma candidum]|uniref:Uncharacterized protein n=1 Tax=Melastoma candidum TaxID=119954 RepID=A0ACB9N4A5_9MYRT|nr:hypothetical protein MLD38_029625 [Melastoma candidum]
MGLLLPANISTLVVEFARKVLKQGVEMSIPLSISRVNQFDAARLDVEMSAMLKEQLVKAFSLMKFSIWVDKPMPGIGLMNLRYTDAAAPVERGISEQAWKDQALLLLRNFGIVLPLLAVSIYGLVFNLFLHFVDGAIQIRDRSSARALWRGRTRTRSERKCRGRLMVCLEDLQGDVPPPLWDKTPSPSPPQLSPPPPQSSLPTPQLPASVYPEDEGGEKDHGSNRGNWGSEGGGGGSTGAGN